MNRRSFLAGAAAGALTSAAGERPNIFFALADDMSFPHMSCAGDAAIRTPAMDRVAREGVRFTQAYCCSPSCTPSRAADLTGQYIWRLKESGNLWSTLRKSEFPVYPDLLEAAGYHVGLMGKGWGPGDFHPGGFARNPAGPSYKSFAEFLPGVPAGKPFCFWLGSVDPHRPYDAGSGKASGIDLGKIRVPPFLPDAPEVRSDIADYMFEVQRFDRAVGEALSLLEKAGTLANTLVIVTSDNGMPFPRCKTNLYDWGTRMPLVAMWKNRIKGGRVVDDFVNQTDFAPTFLEAAGLKPPAAMTGRSFLSVLTSSGSGLVDRKRDHVLTGRERHTTRTPGGVGYPMRALRTTGWLYIKNYEPERGPEGAAPNWGDIDDGPTKMYMAGHGGPLWDLAVARRPAEELYDSRADPYQMHNLAADPKHAGMLRQMRERLRAELAATGDPRETGGEIIWDTTPYHGGK